MKKDYIDSLKMDWQKILDAYILLKNKNKYKSTWDTKDYLVILKAYSSRRMRNYSQIRKITLNYIVIRRIKVKD